MQEWIICISGTRNQFTKCHNQKKNSQIYKEYDYTIHQKVFLIYLINEINFFVLMDFIQYVISNSCL